MEPSAVVVLGPICRLTANCGVLGLGQARGSRTSVLRDVVGNLQFSILKQCSSTGRCDPSAADNSFRALSPGP